MDKVNTKQAFEKENKSMPDRKVLAEFFKGVALKYASRVEIDSTTSHQHELNGVTPLRAIFGDERRYFSRARFIAFGDDSSAVNYDGNATWYNARERHPTRTEYRLYYSDNDFISSVQAGDLLVIALLENEELMIASARYGSEVEKELLWLFAPADQEIGEQYTVRTQENMQGITLNFVVRTILSLLGIDTFEKLEGFYLDEMSAKFGETFPGTSVFSTYASNTLSIPEEPDAALLLLMEREEALFRLFEKAEVEQRLEKGFRSAEEFEGYAKSFMNRRYSRAGRAFENHLARVFRRRKLRFSERPVTELRKRPDFVFPGIETYQELAVNPDLEKYVTVLGAKTSCKDRWRQIVNEADRVRTKHLATLQPSISGNQITEMQAENVVLVIPEEIRQTYPAGQRNDILNLANFIDIVKNRQNAFNEVSGTS